MVMRDDTKGGIKGHVVRRLIHVCTFLIPLVYYFWLEPITTVLKITPGQVVIIIVAIILILENIRLKMHLTFFGQRPHEARGISSFAWGTFSIGLVLLFAPGPQFGIPIIWSCAFADPVLGELKSLGIKYIITFIVGFLLISLIWWLCHQWLNTPVLWAPIMGIIITLVEKPNFKWIDDNALMQLVPLGIVLLAKYFGVAMH